MLIFYWLSMLTECFTIIQCTILQEGPYIERLSTDSTTTKHVTTHLGLNIPAFS